MAEDIKDADSYFRPRIVRKQVTNDWNILPIPSQVRKIEFRCSGGTIGLRVNSTVANYMDISPGDYPFQISLDKDMIIHVRGQSGGEKLICYVE